MFNADLMSQSVVLHLNLFNLICLCQLLQVMSNQQPFLFQLILHFTHTLALTIIMYESIIHHKQSYTYLPSLFCPGAVVRPRLSVVTTQSPWSVTEVRVTNRHIDTSFGFGYHICHHFGVKFGLNLTNVLHLHNHHMDYLRETVYRCIPSRPNTG